MRIDGQRRGLVPWPGWSVTTRIDTWAHCPARYLLSSDTVACLPGARNPFRGAAQSIMGNAVLLPRLQPGQRGQAGGDRSV